MEENELEGMAIEVCSQQITGLMADLFESLHLATWGFDGTISYYFQRDF